MATNADVQAAWDFHNGTKHSLESVRADRHRLDWANQPRPYKLYATDLEEVPLPVDLGPSGVPALAAIGAGDRPRDRVQVPDLATLATVLHFTAGITKQLRYPGGLMDFRAAACTGALYHIELYLVSGPLPGLDAGVYQFSVPDRVLRRLRAGDYRGVLTSATGGEATIAAAPVSVVATSTFWRNSWKYQSRAYRHTFWDSGTMLANLLAMAAARDLPARVVTGFADAEVDRLLDLDGEHEASVAVVPLGYAPDTAADPAPAPAPLHLATVPESARPVAYPAIPAMHAASSLASGADAGTWRGAAASARAAAPDGAESGRLVPLALLPREALPQAPIEEVIRKRGSSRRFEPSPIPFAALSEALAAASGELSADFRGADGSALSTMYLIVNAVDGLPSGTYVFHRDRQALELLRAGDFRRAAGYLDLGQELGGDAAVDVYFLADLEPILARLGNRGYRAAHLDASITAGKLYLAAYALGFGASGLTFFDDDVTEFFSPHARGKSVMFLIALGQPARRPG